MNIGIVTTWFERGAAYVSRQYQQTLEKAGNNVFIFARDGDYAHDDPNWDKPNVHWARTWPITDASRMQIRDFRRWLVVHQIELVIFNEQRVLWPIAICQRLGIRTVAYIDYYRETSVNRFACYDGLICNTKRHFSVFSWHPGAFYLPWGTDTSLYSPKDSETTLVSQGKVTFFHSAGCSDRKGTDFLIKAFANVNGPSKLVIHSQIDILRWFPEMTNLVRDLEACDRLVRITKTIPAPGLYHMGDVYVYPSRLEGIGLTICEAMSCGLPVIVPDNAPMNEFVDPSISGLLIAVHEYVSRADGYYWPMGIVSIDSLTEQMQFCVDHPVWVATAKRQARSKAIERWNWSANSQGLPTFLENLPSNGNKISRDNLVSRMVKKFRGFTDM